MPIFQCPECGLSFKTSRYKGDPKRKHTLRSQCPHCGTWSGWAYSKVLPEWDETGEIEIRSAIMGLPKLGVEA